MAEEQDKSQQTEEPTAKRLEQARESGDVVKSAEVTSFVLLAGGTLAIAMFGRSTMVALARMLTMFIQQPDQIAVDGADLMSLSRGVLWHSALALAPFMGVMVVAGLAGHVLQSRPIFNAEKIKPDLIFLTGDYVSWEGDYKPALK